MTWLKKTVRNVQNVPHNLLRSLIYFLIFNYHLTRIISTPSNKSFSLTATTLDVVPTFLEDTLADSKTAFDVVLI